MCANAAGYSPRSIQRDPEISGQSSGSDRSLGIAIIPISYRRVAGRGTLQLFGAHLFLLLSLILAAAPQRACNLLAALGACLYVKLFLIMQQRQEQRQQQMQHLGSADEAGFWPTVGQFIARQDGLGQAGEEGTCLGGLGILFLYS